MTPLETQFPVETQYTVPGAYFSPLTSPALHAQNESTTGFEQRLASGNSPTDMELEALPAPAPSAADGAKKGKKNSTAKVRKSNVRQSPISKPQRKKTATTPIINAQALDQLAESIENQGPGAQQQQQPQPSRRPIASAGGATDSENGSVTPETLTDMPPPPIPKPKSARPSPYMQPQNNNSAPPSQPVAPGQQHPSPATPASLMKLASPKTGKAGGGSGSGGQEGGGTEAIETFELPESLNVNFQRPPQLTPLTTRSPMASPSLEPGAAAAAAQPLPSPLFAKPTAAASASQSPQLAPGVSSSALNPRRTPQMLPRGSKKRGSVSSVHVSPALRPKISPNIKPLLPGGATAAEDQASRLLASKSNYQNILEGNTVPGVSYPSELSTNLTSKRTSHKIAEQGRRNRINSALQEIATLLPRPPPQAAAESKGSDGDSAGGKDGKDGKGAAAAAAAAAAGGGGNTPNSKASTVEMAIEYIKQLKQEVAEANRRADEAEKKLGLKS